MFDDTADWGSWEELLERVHMQWGITPEHVDVPEGDTEGLIEFIQEQTGESVDEIRTRLTAEEDPLLDTDADDFDSL